MIIKKEEKTEEGGGGMEAKKNKFSLNRNGGVDVENHFVKKKIFFF